MTRINSDLETCRLSDEHLKAEIRELPRIPSLIVGYIEKKKKVSEIIEKIPENFRLGKGHVLFFYDKIKFLERRYFKLLHSYKERYNKEYNDELVDFFKNNINKIKNNTPSLYKEWFDENDILKGNKEIIGRISIRITESKQIPHYYRTRKNKNEMIKIVENGY